MLVGAHVLTGRRHFVGCKDDSGTVFSAAAATTTQSGKDTNSVHPHIHLRPYPMKLFPMVSGFYPCYRCFCIAKSDVAIYPPWSLLSAVAKVTAATVVSISTPPLTSLQFLILVYCQVKCDY